MNDVGDSVEIAKVQTSGCPESCSGPQMGVERIRWGMRFVLEPCGHTLTVTEMIGDSGVFYPAEC